MNTCPHCQSNDTLEPFEMDGIKDGKYHVRGLWWLHCRACERTSNVPAPSVERAA
jgi:hypothetical protein